jgi:SprT protein
MSTPQQLQIVQKCKDVFAKAKELYPHLSFDQVQIRFDLKGRCAGMAGRRYGYYVRFNRDMLTREAFDHVLNDTVPHEIAHIVCFMDPSLGRNHDWGWSRVCRQLGGSGARTHKEEVVYGKGATYEYTTDRGHKVRVSQTIHKKIQRGIVYTYKLGKGKVSSTSPHTIVGLQGKTLANPKVVVAPPTYIAPTPTFAPAVQRPTQPAQVITGPALATALNHMPPVMPTTMTGESKAATSRRIMLAGKSRNMSHEEIIQAMMLACGYDRQLARATFKANADKVGIQL